MKTYKNDYTRQEDELLWELHNIRHQLHNEWSDKSLAERNEEIKKSFKKRKQEWQKKQNHQLDHSSNQPDQTITHNYPIKQSMPGISKSHPNRIHN